MVNEKPGLSDISITSELVVAYSQCPFKAYLLLFSDDKGMPHDYTRVLNSKQYVHRHQYLEHFKLERKEAKLYSPDLFQKTHLLVEASIQFGKLKAYGDVLISIDSNSIAGKIIYEPTIVISTYKISQEQEVELQYVGIVLGKLQKKQPSMGNIVTPDGKTHKLKLEKGYRRVNGLLKTLEEWAENKPSNPPPLIINKHCQSCQFRNSCKVQAEKENHLSLLDRITPKAIARYNKRGIFTIYQLSYLYKPRKRQEKSQKLVVKHSLELQALAIREKRIYLQALPDVPSTSTKIFLDIEGIPEQKFQYLIGILVCEDNKKVYFSFWADSPSDEENIYTRAIAKINEYPQALIYHYGSYEAKAIAELNHKYKISSEELSKRLVNVNSYIYGKIYFPTLSNGLKDIGSFIGYSWQFANSSGLQAIAWRYLWEESRKQIYQEMLLAYNQDDCEALRALTDEIFKIKENAESSPHIDFADKPKRFSTEKGQEAHEQFEIIIKSAHSDYDRNKISFVSIEVQEKSDTQEEYSRRRYHTHRKVIPKARKLIESPTLISCPIHNKNLIETTIVSRKSIIDLIFTRNGVKKTVSQYYGFQSYCLECDRYYNPPLIDGFKRSQIYGHGFQVWVTYQRIALRLPHRTITQAIEDQFDEVVTSSTVRTFIRYAAEYYAETEKLILQRLLESPFVHADETTIVIEGKPWYVWTFTNGKYVLYKLTQTRESKIASDILLGYSGVLISDFYCGYDSINCRQQKCWVHLIRDLNEDLWKAPYDKEYENFVLEIRNLMLPIFKSIEKYGSRKDTLQKFANSVDRFYIDCITNKFYSSELVIRYQKRFERYRDSLFTFLSEDKIPWHNNTAENAIRHIAKQRAISGSFFEAPTRSYLLLVGIYKTCRFQNKSFLKFLLSREKDIDRFKPRRRSKKNTIPVGQAKRLYK